MNTFGKVLVIVVFVLSIAFAVAQMVLFSERTQYREQYEQEAEQRRRVERELEEATSDLEGVRREIDRLQATTSSRIEELEGQVENLHRDKTKLDADLESKKADLSEAVHAQEALWKRIDGKDEAIEELEGKVEEKEQSLQRRRAEIGELEENIRDHRRTLEEKEEEIAELTEEKDRALTRLQDRERQLAELEARGVHVDIGKPLPPIDGAVSRVDNEIGVAVLNRGSEDGVEINFDFVVYREDAFIARLYVMDVYPDNSLARVDRELTDLEEQPLQVGDRVTTRIR